MKKISDNAYFFSAATNVGVINVLRENMNHIYLIDTGNGVESGFELWKELELEFFNKGGFVIDAIINTHGHVDHVGLNNFIQERSKCRIYLADAETVILKNPCASIERIWGANCIHQLKKWYTLKEKFEVTDIIASGDSIQLADGGTINFIPLYGHSSEHLGVLYTDSNGKKILFAGDSFLGLDELEKCRISYQESPLTALETMEKIQRLEVDCIVQSHGQVEENIDTAKDVVKKNAKALKKLINLIYDLTGTKKCTLETIVEKSIKKFNVSLRPVSYALISSTIKSLLSELYESGELGISLKKGKFYWTKEKF